MKKKSTQRIAAWLLAAGMMAGTFAQPMAVYAESTASIAASDSTTGDSITADADVVIATPTPEPDTGTDTAATPVPTADSQTPQDPASTAAPETTPAPDAAEDVPTPTPIPTPTPAAENTADDAADTDDTTDTTTTVTPADLQSCIALLAASQLSLDADSIEPDVREETLALSDEITETEPSTLQAMVNAAVFAAPADQTDIVVDVPANNYTGTLVIPDATIVGKDPSGNEINISYANKNIILNMTDSTLTVPTDAAVGVSVFGSLTIRGGTIKAADGCTATRGVQVQLGSALTLDGTTISDFTYAGPGAGVYVKGTAAVDTNGQFDVALGKNQEPLQNADNTYQFKKLQRENGSSMDTSFTMKGGTTITSCKSDGNGAALYVHNAALLTLESANFTNNNAGGFGGAVYLGTGVQTTIGNGVTFTGNHAAKDGGALYLANQYTLHVKADNILVQVPVTFNGGTFTENSTDTYGGALAFDPAFDGIADNTIENVTFGQAETTTSDDENAEEETTLHGNYAALRGGAIAFNSNIKENTLLKCTFTGNTALRYAGAVYYPNTYGKTTEFNPVYTVDGCTFDRNSATYDVKNGDDAGGGAILMQVNPTDTPNTVQVASLYVKNSTFTGNTATGCGGAISTRREANRGNARIYLNIDNSTFDGNRATSAGNGGWRGGGAVWVSGYAWADFTANTFTGNYSAHFGGAIATNNDNGYRGRVITLGALQEDGTPDPDKANTFTNNSANSWGGAISTGATSSGDNTNGIYTTVRIYGGSFAGNTTLWGSGGALYVASGNQRNDLGLEIIGTTFTENKATHSADAGAVYIYGITSSFKDCKFTANSTEQTHGGAMHIQRTKRFDMDNVTFTGNIAATTRGTGQGGAIFINDCPSSIGSTFTWNNVTFDSNTSRSAGGAVTADTNTYLNLIATKITARNNKGTTGGAFYLNQGCIALTDAVFEKNTANGSGGAIYMRNRYSGNSLTIKGKSRFVGNTASSSGGALYFDQNDITYTDDDGQLQYRRGELNITGTADTPIVFSGNIAKNDSGGAIAVGFSNTDKLDYLDVHDNTAKQYGGGIYVNGGATVGTLTNSKIYNNTTVQTGGGVFVYAYFNYQNVKVNNVDVPTRIGEACDFTIENCEVTGNSTTGTDGNSRGGGGIAMGADLRHSKFFGDDSGTLNIINTTVGNNTSGTSGGGVYGSYNTTIKISGSKIANNTAASNGGGVVVRNNTTTIKNGTVIEGNTAGANGGALYTWDTRNNNEKKYGVYEPKLTTEDCTIANNTAKKGGIAYVSAGASFAMGKKTFPDSNEGVGDVFAEKNAGKVTLPAAEQLKGEYDAWLMDDATPIEKAVTNDSSAEHYYTLHGAACFVARLNGLLGSRTGTEYTTLQAALDEAAKKTGTASIDLLADVGEQVTATTENNPITLNLNGYTLTGKITLTNGQNTNAFTLTDETADDYKAGSTGGVLTGPANGIEMNNGTKSAYNKLILTGKTLTLTSMYRGVNAGSYADITVDGLTFTRMTNAGIYTNGNCNIHVSNATFTQNAGNSIVAYNNNNIVTVESTEIYDNKIGGNGMIFVDYNSTLTIEDGSFHDNTSSGNGGIVYGYRYGNKITINGGEYYNNKAAHGGAIYMSQNGTLTINGGSFHDNTATTNGGAIVACNQTSGNHSTTLTITGGEFYNNTAVNGGAVYMSTGTGLGTFTMTGGEIHENTADNGGALYIATKAKVTLSAAEGADVGGIIRDNTASQLASNLYLGGADSSLTVGEKTLLYGGTIAGDVLFAQGGTVDLADTQDLHTDGIENAEDLVWLKNDATTGETVCSENAPAQTIYTLAPAGENTGSYAARIGSDKYFSINQAIKAMEAADAEDAETNTTTIHLLRDQTEDVTVNNTKHSPTLNLNGYTLTGHITVNNLNNVGLTFTLTDDNTQADYNKAGNGGTLTAASGTLVNIKDQSNKPENTTVKLQGVTLTGATRGVYAGRNVNLVAEGSSFSHNTLTASGAAGAAIYYNDNGTLVAANCTFAYNRAENSYGGAIFMNRAADTATIENCTFRNNYAQNQGGAVYLNAHAITLRGNTFAGNTSKNQGGAVYLVPCTNVEKAETEAYGSYDAVLENNTFENNKAYSSGGALYINPSTITVTTLLDHCTFTNNSTTTADGGAAYSNQGTLTLGTGNLFKENKSYNGGSGMYVGGNLYSVRDQKDVTLPESGYDTQFISNTAGYGNYSGGWAALSVGGGATKNMRYMLFDGNVAAYGGTASAIYVGAIGSGTGKRQIWIDHCSIVNNVSPAYTVYLNYAYSLGNLTRITNTEFDKNTITSASRDYAVLYAYTGNNLDVSDTSFTNTQGKGCVIRLIGGGAYKGDEVFEPAQTTFTRVTVKDNTNCQYTPIYLSTENSSRPNNNENLRSMLASSTWNNCIIANNASKATDNYQGGAFRVEKQLFTMNDCEITGNRGQHGAIVLYGPLNPVGKGEQKPTEVNLNKCKIAYNEGGSAGGLWIGGHESYRLTVNLNNCDISKNTSRSVAGGIYAGQLTTLNMNETTVAENTAKTYGGGLYTYGQDDENGNSRVNLTNCKITGNTANYGGGIYMARNQKPEKRDQNHYHDFYVANTTPTQTLNITGSTVANNTALANGGGICTDKDDRDTSYSTLIVKVADGTVENNRAQLGQDVYAYKAKADTVLHLPKASAIHDNGRWLNENTSETLKDEAIDYDPIQRTYPLTLSVPKVETEVAQIVKDGEVVGDPYDSLQIAMDVARAMLAEDADQKLTVQLLTNTNSSTQISQDTNVTLDLAGHTITGIGGKTALTIESDVNIINSKPDGGGTISGTATDGGALLLRNNANVTMTDTTITNSRAAYRGGAVCVDSGSSFTLDRGSTITGCQAGRGGAVYVIDGSFIQTNDAVITNCSVFENAAFSACGYGGAIYVAKGSYTLQSGSVTNNRATQNGIIYIANNSGAEFTMTKGKISGNTCKNGTIYQAGGTMTLAGGSITGNTCTENGGGVYQNGGSSLLLGTTNASQDVVISGNKAVNGAGWYINGGNCLMRGGNITGNKATKRGGGVCQSNGTLTVNGGDITTNNAPEGGGLCHSGGTFNFQGGGLYGNIATGDDGGNDVYSTSKNGVMDLIAAAAMDSDKYNVWRDDYYPYTFTKNYHNTSDKIAAEGSEDGGKYLTSTVPNVNNVKLTADYYENSNIEIESNDMYIYRMSITKQDTGDGKKDYYDAEDGVITAAEVMNGVKANNVKSVEPAGKTYPLNYDKDTPVDVKTEEALKVTYTDGRTEEIVRPETPVQWTAGSDATKDNALIRSFSTANYIVSLDTKSQALNEQLVGATERLWMRIKVPCESGEISLSGKGTVFKSSYTYYDPESHCQILEGYQDHVIEKKDLGTMNMTMQFSIKVGGMHNGTTIQPTIEAWFDNSSYQLYRTKTNPYDDRVALDANIMRVSAKAAYNLSVANNPSLRHIGYFDMATKTEITEAEYNKLLVEGGHNVVYGMMVGYGMALQLRNQDTSKGLRGIEVPSGDITFDVNMQGGLKFNGKTVFYANGGQPVAISPLLWAYKPNESGRYTGYDTSNNTAGINMNWSDEDDDNRSTHYDSKIAMNVDETHSGGTWTALNPDEKSTFTRGDGTKVKQTQLTFKVSGYTMRPISKSNDQAYSFSTGYLQVLIPLELDKYDFAQNDSYEGFLQTDMHMAGGNMTMDNVADADLNGVEAELTDKVNGYFNYTDEGILRSYAKNESTYGDNYDNSSTLGMNISRSRGGNGSYITKTNYWLGSDGKTVLNDDQNKQLGTNVTGIASKVYMTGNLAFGSEEVTPANNTDKFIYDAQVDQQAEYYYLTAYDVLMKFDPSAMRPATYMVDGVEKPVCKMSQKEVAANLKDVTHISLSDNGYSEWDTTKQLTKSYELTILYAAKANDTPVLEDGSEGNGWQYDRWARADGAGLDDSQPLWNREENTRDNGGTADMDKYSFNEMKMTVGSDGATKEIKGLVYYDTLTELEKAGHTCVAVLYQIRNCCVRTGRSVEIGHMMEVTKDVSKIGRSYALTMDVRGWTTYRPFYRSATATGSNPGWTRLMDNGTVLTKRSELLYQGLIEGKGEQAKAPVSHPLTSAKNSTINWDIGTPTINRITNNYQKTQYSNGYEVGGSHSGYLSGNTVLLATQNATVEIETTDVAEGNRRQTDYQLDEGQRTVTVQVTPRVTMQSNAKANLEVFDGTTQTDLTLDVKLPQDLTLQEGTLTFDYSNSSYNRGDLTWEAKYQYWDGMTWQDFDFATDYEQNYVQRPTLLHLTTTITDVKKVLPVLSFKAGIGYPADPGLDITGESDQDGAWYKNLRIDAEIHTTYEEENVNASLGRTDYTEIKVLRNSKTVVNKTAASNLVEIGDVLAYDLTYIKEGGAASDLELCDLLPYNTEKAKTFHGAYGLKSVTVTVQQADGSDIVWNTDDITVKYADTDSVIYNSKDVLDREATMKNAESGTSLTTKNTKGSSVTFTPDTMPIHKATGKSELGSLYLQLQNLPNATIKVRVELAVTQTKDSVNALLTDSDDKTVQQSNDTYNNIYFARAGGESNALLTSPTASIKVRSRSISGLVWMDQNYDGIYTTKLDDTGKKNVGSDKTLAGITVTLVQTEPNTKDENPVYTDGKDNSYYAVTDTLGNKVQPVTTTSDGRYTFENLKQGEYRVLFKDSKDGYKMEDDSKPVLPFGKLSVTKHDDAKGDTSNKTAPQYGTEDANTLQAAMSGEITLGDAVLTGRDDKTNINAGFYYTELRLAKVWQNIPDAKKAAEAKVDFTLAATQGKEKLEEAVYTLSNTAVSKPAKADENAENLALFGTFVGDKVDVTDDSAERTVRWQTTQGLPLQAENAHGPITYTLKQDTVRAGGDTWIGNVSFVQQQDTEKVSSGAESDNSVIATRLVAVNTARIYEILIHKLSDVENKDLEKAEFTATLQPASPLEKLLGGKVEIKSQQTIQRTGENEETEEIRYRLTDLTAGTYTLAETKAPLGYAKDPVKYKLTITDRDENGNTLPIITLEDDKGNRLYTAVMTPDQEKGDYSVDVTAGDGRDTSTASAVMTAGSCLETTEQEQSNLPIRTQISMEITDSYLFSLPFTGGSGMNRSLLQGVAVMALAAAAFAVTAIHRKKKNHS